ncbi:uncharacterized protein BDV17DRAFT_225777 [Aspergillus undulatus]|uniref:uncharacterized protein n=1 Tax=Aspergillus undulatus TaxID=1810928 RepID=UPI003CCDE0F0
MSRLYPPVARTYANRSSSISSSGRFNSTRLERQWHPLAPTFPKRTSIPTHLPPHHPMTGLPFEKKARRGGRASIINTPAAAPSQSGIAPALNCRCHDAHCPGCILIGRL